MSKWPGKKFEEDFVRQIDKDPQYFVHRIRDVQWYAGSVSIADYFIFNGDKLFAMELKSTKWISIPFSRLNMEQRQMMLNNLTVDNFIPGYILNFRRDGNPTYWIHTEIAEQYIWEADRKSIPLAFLEDNCIPIDSSLRQTRYNYQVRAFINNNNNNIYYA